MRRRIIAIFVCLLLGAPGWCDALNVAAFNIQVFGQSKFSKEEVVATLVQVNYGADWSELDSVHYWTTANVQIFSYSADPPLHAPSAYTEHR